MGKVANSAIDPASNERTPGIVAYARFVGPLLPGQDVLLHLDNFIDARGEAENEESREQGADHSPMMAQLQASPQRPRLAPL